MNQPTELVDAATHSDERSCIALFLGGGKNQRLLAGRLRETYDIVQVDSDGLNDAAFDLCIVDTRRFLENRSALEARKRAAEPLVLPYLLVSRRDLDSIAPEVWNSVDDVITTPIKMREIAPRIESLLELGRLSRQVRQQRRLEEVASVISHDLRSPLEVAKGNLDLTRESGDPEYIEKVEQAHERMEALISDVLTLARQGSDDTEVSKVSLSAVVDEIWGTTETGEAVLDTSFEEDTVLYADERRLRQLLANLMVNANEHNDGSVTVSIGDIEGGFYLEDDGDGLPENVGTKVLDTGISTSRDGTGLGLSIVQRIADAHGWSFSVGESDAGGVRFEFTDVTTPETVNEAYPATATDRSDEYSR